MDKGIRASQCKGKFINRFKAAKPAIEVRHEKDGDYVYRQFLQRLL